ncbi:hypothetical protein GCM10010236_49550 [Streptomyces eurythermus]|nr:hypothetical protein GCM10010236_49550 [Streptomyces eurythermus]
MRLYVKLGGRQSDFYARHSGAVAAPYPTARIRLVPRPAEALDGPAPPYASPARRLDRAATVAGPRRRAGHIRRRARASDRRQARHHHRQEERAGTLHPRL